MNIAVAIHNNGMASSRRAEARFSGMERNPARPTRRAGLATDGRRLTDRPLSLPWTPAQLADHIGMSAAFVRSEIGAGELKAAKFGSEYRIAVGEIIRYLTSKGFPLPAFHTP